MALVPPPLPFPLSPNPFLLHLKLNPGQSFMAISSSWLHRCCHHSWWKRKVSGFFLFFYFLLIMVVEEQGTGFCHGGGRGRGWVVRVDGYGSFWWVLRWFSWWDLWWLWYGWWVFGGWLGLCGGMSGWYE